MTTEDEKISKNILNKFRQPKFMLLFVVAIILIGGISYAVMEKVSANPAFCASCHNMQPYYDSYKEGNLLAKKHADANVTCHDCHEPSFEQQATEGIKQITGNYKDPLPAYEYSNELCLKCHDFEKVKSKTAFLGKANPHASTHDEGNETPDCYKCHSVHHLQSTEECGKCHPAPWLDQVDDSWKK